MRLPLGLSLMFVTAMPASANSDTSNYPELQDYSIYPLIGEPPIHRCPAYRGSVVLAVNTAGKCACIPLFAGLGELYAKYKSRGPVVLGFPSGDFGGQVPGGAREIAECCTPISGADFPAREQSATAEGRAAPFSRAPGEAVGESSRWSSRKHLIDRSGRLSGSFSSRVRPTGGIITAREPVL